MKRNRLKTTLKKRSLMMKVKDVFTNGLFRYINYTIDPFTNIELDFIFLSKYGEREISPIVERLIIDGVIQVEDMEMLGSVINKTYGPSWESQDAVLSYEFTPFENYYETVTVQKESSNTNTGINEDSIYAFNSINSSDTAKREVSNENNLTEEETQTRKGLRGVDYSDIYDQALRIKALKLVDIIMRDVKNFTTLDVYI